MPGWANLSLSFFLNINLYSCIISSLFIKNVVLIQNLIEPNVCLFQIIVASSYGRKKKYIIMTGYLTFKYLVGCKSVLTVACNMQYKSLHIRLVFIPQNAALCSWRKYFNRKKKTTTIYFFSVLEKNTLIKDTPCGPFTFKNETERLIGVACSHYLDLQEQERCTEHAQNFPYLFKWQVKQVKWFHWVLHWANPIISSHACFHPFVHFSLAVTSWSCLCLISILYQKKLKVFFSHSNFKTTLFYSFSIWLKSARSHWLMQWGQESTQLL